LDSKRERERFVFWTERERGLIVVVRERVRFWRERDLHSRERGLDNIER